MVLNMNLPLISVVMTVHNSEEYLMESINSVLTQSYANLQIIIVDDGSTDKKSLKNKVFYDEKLTSAIIDRLVHHSHLLVFQGQSYRLTHSTMKSH